MSEKYKNSGTKTTRKKSIRPALIVSAETVSEYSTFLRYLLIGLVDESIPAALICPAKCNLASIVPPSVNVITHPAFNLPLMWRQNRRKLIEERIPACITFVSYNEDTCDKGIQAG